MKTGHHATLLMRLAALGLAAMLAGCLATTPQLAKYQIDRDAMMAAGNRDRN